MNLFSFIRSHGAAVTIAVLSAVISGPATSCCADEMSDQLKSSQQTSEAQFLAENEISMSRMMEGMSGKPTGDIDRDFVVMMVPHHQGAIDMAKSELKYGHSEQLRRLAQEIIVTQQQEIAVMRLAIGENDPVQQVPASDGAMKMK
jgi:uncharacterized protein (DUF305 family)